MSVTMREMLEAGVHFGHQTRFWNPKMAPYICGHRNKIHIINLEKTLPMYREAIALEAARAGMPYINIRWLGGMLTNFKTLKASIKKMKEIESIAASGALENMS